MKRKIVAVVLASTMVFGMTACGSSGASDSSSTGSDAATDDTATDDGSEDANVTEGSSDDENTLTVWTWDPNFNIYAIEKAAEIYAKDHPGFKVDVSEIKSDDIETRLTTAVSAGDLSTLPDIFLMQDNSFQKYVTFYPDVFTSLADSGIDFTQFSAAKIQVSTSASSHRRKLLTPHWMVRTMVSRLITVLLSNACVPICWKKLDTQ